MFRGIVFGDLWGIKEDVWVQLWSGTVGAMVSAGVAALVAIFVLRRSNKHQQLLIEQQIATQRAAEVRSREKSAMAEILSATHGFLRAMNEGEDAIAFQSAEFMTNVFRWSLEAADGNQSADSRASTTLRTFGNLLSDTASGTRKVVERDGWDGANRSPWGALFADTARAVTDFGMNWYSSESNSKAALRRFVGNADRLNKRMKQLENSDLMDKFPPRGHVVEPQER